MIIIIKMSIRWSYSLSRSATLQTINRDGAKDHNLNDMSKSRQLPKSRSVQYFNLILAKTGKCF